MEPLMTIRHISPADVPALVARGAVLVDIREADEWRQMHIPAAVLHPLSQITRNPPPAAARMIFHCQSGARTGLHAARLAELVPGAEVLLLDGGIDGWRRAGLPVWQDGGRRPGIPGRILAAARALRRTSA
jgi:rhodanese-related sulfurtransferase